MLEEIASILTDQCGLEKERPVIAGVSGGPDSLCLLHLLHRAGYSLCCAHFDHRLRPESGEEAGAVEAAARGLHIPFALGSGDVRAHAGRHGLSIEEAARHLRYAFLFDQARRRGAQAVAVGHTADDQVETVLMHFLRGAGLAGLKGMPYRTRLPVFDPEIPVVRPLLDTWREQTVAYCDEHTLQPHHDPSNDSPQYLRNRLRLTLIPELEKYNPQFRAAVRRAAHTLADDHALLQEFLDVHWNASLVWQDSDAVVLSAAALETLPAALRRGLIRRAVETLRPGQETGYAALERGARFLVDPRRSRQIDLAGGLGLLRDGDHIYVHAAGAELPSVQWPQLQDPATALTVSIPGELTLAGGWRFTVAGPRPAARTRRPAVHNGDPFQVRLDAAALPVSLELRARRPGDRFQPLGLDGHSQKLSDFFVNEKVPQRARDRWPLLCSGDTVIWVPGYRPAHAFRLTRLSRTAIEFTLRQL